MERKRAHERVFVAEIRKDRKAKKTTIHLDTYPPPKMY